MLRHVTIFRVYILLILVLCAGCCLAPVPDSGRLEWWPLLFIVSLLGIVVLCMARLWLALLRKRLSYDAHGSELAVVLTTLALLLLGSLAFGPIC